LTIPSPYVCAQKLTCTQFGERHLNYLVQMYVHYYNGQRSHSRRDYLPPAAVDPPLRNDSAAADDIVRQERLGGVIAWYERRAA
jgi:hypothetical protein